MITHQHKYDDIFSHNTTIKYATCNATITEGERSVQLTLDEYQI